ncbi:MAG: hypothetical protein ABSG13_23905 [Bryobacteraceae bacterium]|jgi:predicted RNase H-like HicB family nuclease
MVVAEVLDFPGVASQGFDIADARLMIASVLQDIAQMHLEEGKALPVPNPDATGAHKRAIPDSEVQPQMNADQRR